MRFQILDNKRRPIETKTFKMDGSLNEANSQLKYWRFEHRATIGYNFKQYMAFVDNLTQQFYIEEIDGGTLRKIDNDDLFEELFHFVDKHHLLDIKIPLVK